MVPKAACLIAMVLVIGSAAVAGAPVGGASAAGFDSGGTGPRVADARPAVRDAGPPAPDAGPGAFSGGSGAFAVDSDAFAVDSDAFAGGSGAFAEDSDAFAVDSDVVADDAGALPTGDESALRSAQAEECTYPLTRLDATGEAVTVPEAPRRVVTLGPSAAQTMWEIGGREKVVGVSQFATYLENASTRTNVSGAGRTPVNVEAVVSLQPDLVLAPNVIPDETVEALRRTGLTVFKFPAAESIEDVYWKTRLTGRLTGECEGAAETVAWMRDRLSTVRAAVAGEPRPRVLYAFFGFTAGNGTFVHEVVTTAGGRNVAAEAGISGFARLNEEVVVRGDPEWILLNSDGPRVPRSAAFNSTTAVREGQTVVVDANYVSQPAPRIVYPVQTLAAALHPEAYAAANATGTPETDTPETDTPTVARTTTVTPSPAPTDGSTSGASPGTETGAGNPTGQGAIPAAGPAAALAAVLGGGVLAARRRA